MLRSIRNSISRFWKFSIMNENPAAKRPFDLVNDTSQLSKVKATKTEADADSRVEQIKEERKRKVAILIAYCGAGYHGIQINKGVPTIESVLMAALVAAGFIPEEHREDMSKMSYQRASRTDKGVSAAGQVVSLKMLINAENIVAKINEHLPPQIRAVAYKRATKSFNSKNFCDGRTYIYLLPTFAFSPCTETTTDEYRITDEILEDVNDIFMTFKGTHNFHNFTSGVKPDDKSAIRYMMHLQVGRPFVRQRMEWAIITVKGQSFMLHHIRKMIGLTIAIVRGFAQRDVLDKVYEKEKVDVPKAPGLGLVLDQLHYDVYNKRYGSDGIHEALEWSQYQDVLDDFKEKQIFSNIIKTEKEEHSMLMWLSTLHHHHCDVNPSGTPRSPLGTLTWKLSNLDKVKEPWRTYPDRERAEVLLADETTNNVATLQESSRDSSMSQQIPSQPTDAGSESAINSECPISETSQSHNRSNTALNETSSTS